MEDVLDVYQLPYDEMRPVVCFDETSKQLVAHARTPIPPRPGSAARVDDEYTREGTANIFAAIEPITGKAAATTILLVMDNLSTHSIACLYEAFPPAEARRIARRFEIHHTPRHGSWLDVAEIFLSTMSIECLDQRVPDAPTLRALVDAWLRSRKSGKVRWRFRADDARIKLHRLYPSLP